MSTKDGTTRKIIPIITNIQSMTLLNFEYLLGYFFILLSEMMLKIKTLTEKNKKIHGATEINKEATTIPASNTRKSSS